MTLVAVRGILRRHWAPAKRAFQINRDSNRRMQPVQEMPTEGLAARRRTWVIVFCLAVAVRLLNIVFLPTSPEAILQEDASLYWNGAAVLLENGSFSRTFSDGLLPQTERVPGYFLFLAATRALFGDSLIAVLIVQALVDAVTCVLIANLAGLLSPHLALPTGILSTLWPNLIVHSGMVLSDTLFLMLFTLMLTAAGRFLTHGDPRWAALAGLALGLSILTRPVAQLLPFLMLPAAFILPLRNGRGVGAAVLAVALFSAGAILPLTPLLYRNYDQFGAIALSSQTGAHLIGWVAPLVRRAADGTPREIGAAELAAEALARTVVEGQKPEDVNFFEQSKALTQIGLEAIGRYPIAAVASAWANGAAINIAAPAIAVDRRIRTLPHASFDAAQGDGVLQQTVNILSDSSIAYVVIMGGGILLSLAFLGLQTYGFVVLARVAPWPALFAALCIGYFLAVNGPVGSPKYRLPFEPVLIVLSALALIDFKARYLRRGL